MSPVGSGRRIPVFALLILLILVSAAFAYYYQQSQSTISQQAQEITRLQQEESKLNITILSLDANVSGFETNLTTSYSRMASLQLQVNRLEGQLEDQAALDSLEFGILYKVTGLSVSPALVNATISLSSGGIQVFGSSSAGPGQTLAFISKAGCPVSGIRVVQAQPEVIAIILDSRVSPVTSYYNSTGTQPYTIEFDNVGPGSVQCTYSLFSVAP